MNKYKSRDLKGVTRCSFRRSRNLNLESGKKNELIYQKAALIKSVIKDSLVYGYTDAGVKKSLDQGFMDLGYELKKTAKEQSNDAYKQIMRYLKSEKRMPVIYPGMTVKPFNLIGVEVFPDLVFYGEKDFEYTAKDSKGKKITWVKREPYIEVVKICCKLPDITATGNKKDSSAGKSLELYSYLKYARELIESDELIHIGASYYFLRKKNDGNIEDIIHDDFFDTKGAGNIVSLWEIHSKDSNEPEIMDRMFKPQFEEFVAGEDVCDEKVCKHCEFYGKCYYKRPPKYKNTEEKTTKLDDVALSKEQEKAVYHRKGIARINAGAGAGKTLVSALRVATMLDEGINPQDICMLTFTDTGAKEMTKRVKMYCDDMECDADVSKITSTTFNAFGDRIVRENYKDLGFTEPPRLIDDIERFGILEKLLGEHTISGLDYKNFNMNLPHVKGALHLTKEAFEIIKKERFTLGDEKHLKEQMTSSGCVTSERGFSELIELYALYDEILHKKNLIEYADQELLIMELLIENPYYFEDYGYKHIMVDEFQDCNDLQLEIIKKLIDTPFFESLMVVGDDSQSIFGFRGSNPEVIINFWNKIGENGKDFYLLENHRSTPEIIDFANKINALNKNRVIKDLIATKSHGKNVCVEGFWKKDEINDYTLKIINEKIKEGYAYENIAYIASKRTELMNMGSFLTENEIPWIMLNPEPILENTSVIAALSLAVFMDDETATKQAFTYLNACTDNKMLDMLKDEHVKKSIEWLRIKLNAIKENEDLESYIKLINRLDNNDEIFNSLKKSLLLRTTLEDITQYSLDYLKYGDGQSKKREMNYPGVVLTTAHSSKGMEFPIVINNISEYHTKNSAISDIEEKRRLFFVSSTRAKNELYVIGKKVAFGAKKDRTYNMFLVDAYNIVGKHFSTEEPVNQKKTK